MNPMLTTRRRRPSLARRLATHPAVVPILVALIIGLGGAIAWVIFHILTAGR